MQSMKETIREVREAADREFNEIMESFPNVKGIDNLDERFFLAKKIGAPLQVNIPKRLN